MLCELNIEQLLNLVNHQLEKNWGGAIISLDYTELYEIKNTLERLEKCLEKVNSTYFNINGETAFKIEHTVQYTIFLYILSNELYKSQKKKKASFVYYLNKIMNSVEWFYAVDLPKHFFAEHPLGSVLGKATYGDYFWIYQGVTVGGNWKGDKICYPVIGEHVTMFSNSTVLGDCHIGNNTIIAANTYIKDMDIPDNSIIFGQYPNLIIKKNGNKLEQITNHIWKN